MQPQSELLKISKPSRPYSSLRVTRAAQIAKETSVSQSCLRASSSLILHEADWILPHRSEMGELEPGNLCVHTVWHDRSFAGTRSIGTDPFKRCSGIHRGMGTHISRVKSVDLDAWTDEQLQSVLRWGNSRANK